MVRGATLASLHHFHMLDMDSVATLTVPISPDGLIVKVILNFFTL